MASRLSGLSRNSSEFRLNAQSAVDLWLAEKANRWVLSGIKPVHAAQPSEAEQAVRKVSPKWLPMNTSAESTRPAKYQILLIGLQQAIKISKLANDNKRLSRELAIMRAHSSPDIGG